VTNTRSLLAVQKQLIDIIYYTIPLPKTQSSGARTRRGIIVTASYRNTEILYARCIKGRNTV
jgi:hypothetical protein